MVFAYKKDKAHSETGFAHDLIRKNAQVEYHVLPLAASYAVCGMVQLPGFFCSRMVSSCEGCAALLLVPLVSI